MKVERPVIKNGKTGIGNFGVAVMPDGTQDSLRTLITPDGFHFENYDFDGVSLATILNDINPRLDKFANNYHLNNPLGTAMNDIQTGFYRDGIWHLYYLYNADVLTNGNGTEWYHVTTSDWVKFKNEGVAIHKYLTKYGDISTGTIWEDNDNISGKGEGTLFAMVSSYSSLNGQNIMMYYSTDNGYNYTSFSDEPILKHPDGKEDFRDPYIFRYDNKFIMYLAEDNFFGVYVSDKIDSGYEYKGSYEAPHPMLECPNLFVMNTNNDATNKKWVLIYSGNDTDLLTGTYASVGHLDSNYVFVPEQENIRIDFGPDFYAAKPFADTATGGDVNDHILCVGWLGSWGYVGDVPRETRNGVGASSCRSLKLSFGNGKYNIKSTIVGVLDYAENPVVGNNLKSGTELPMFKGDSFYLKLKMKDITNYQGDFFITLFGNEYDISVTCNLGTNNFSVHRYNSSFKSNDKFNMDHSFTMGDKNYNDAVIQFYVDRTVIEIIAPDGSIYTMTKFPIGISREKINVSSSSDVYFDYEYYQISNNKLIS